MTKDDFIDWLQHKEGELIEDFHEHKMQEKDYDDEYIAYIYDRYVQDMSDLADYLADQVRDIE